MKQLTILLLFFSVFTFAQQKGEKHQRAQIFYSQSSDLTTLENLGVPVEHGNHKPGYFIISDFSEKEIDIARKAGYQVDILIEDSTEYFLQQNASRNPARNLTCAEMSANDYPTPANFNLGSMGGFLTYQEMLNELDDMAAAYPNLITVKAPISDTGGTPFVTQGEPDNTVTPSIGGNHIQWVKISDNPNTDEAEPQILYSAIHHAREPMSLSQLIYYMWYLLENYETDTEVQGIVNNTELFFIPVLNPDGYLHNESTDPDGGGFWRKNRRNNGNGTFGVDNNRNYDYYIGGDVNDGVWGGEGTSTDGDSDVYHGTTPFSEVENQAMKSFVEQHEFLMAFNNHSFGNLLLYPYGYALNVPTPENELFRTIGDELVSQNGFNNMISSGLYAAAGDSDDFMYGTVGTHEKIYAYTPEIGSAFWPQANQIDPIAKSMMYLNLTSSKMVNNYAAVNETTETFIGNNSVNNANFDIRRMGIQGDGNFTVSLNPVSSNIVAAGTPVSFNGLSLLESDSGTIQYSLGSTISLGDVIVFELVINNGMYDSKIVVTKYFGTLETIFEDDATNIDNFTSNGWSATVEDFVSPTRSITDSPSSNYDNNEDKTITLDQSIDLTNAVAANVSFYTKFEIESGFDYAQFEISIDNGATWIPQCGNYTTAGSSNDSQPEGEPLYDGNQSTWVLEEINLSDYIGEVIKARFEFKSDSFQTRDGFYFDDLKFSIIEDDPLNIENFDTQFGIYPNPVKDILNITTALNNYDVTIYTLQGQLVSKKRNYSGSQQINYSTLSSGIYILTLESNGNKETIRIIKE